MNEKEFTESTHILIHSLRLIEGYKPSNAEKKIAQQIIEMYKDKCQECKDAEQRMKYAPQNQTGFLNKLFGGS